MAEDNSKRKVIEGIARPFNASASHTEGKGIGWDMGYSTLGLFASRAQCENPWIPFLDVQGHIFNDGFYAGNAGLGLRYAPYSVAWGVNSYYDYRQTHHKNYHQIGVGLEAIGSYWSACINGYVPLGDTHSSLFDRSLKSRGSGAEFSYFKGNQLFVHLVEPNRFSGKQEVALKWIDAAFFIRPVQKGFFSLDCGLGPYYICAPKGNTAIGGQVSVNLGFTEYLTCNARTTYDTLFQQRAQVELRLSIPFGKPPCSQGKRPLQSQAPLWIATRFSQGASRSEIIALRTKTAIENDYTEAVSTPRFYFVDNQSHSLGTFESPFSRLEQALSVAHERDIIYIYPGDLSLYEANGVLLDHQQLLGSGHEHFVETQHGTIRIPAHTRAAPALRAHLTLGHNNTLSGLNLHLAQAEEGIQGIGCKGFTFTRNCVQEDLGADATALSLRDFSGVLTFRDNQFALDGAGLFVQGQGNSVSMLHIANNLFSRCASQAVALQSQDHASTSLLFEGNQLLECKQGLLLSFNDSSQADTLVLEHNQFLAQHRGVYLALQHLAQVSHFNCSHNEIVFSPVTGSEPITAQGIEIVGKDQSILYQVALSDNAIHFDSLIDSLHKSNGITLATLDQAQIGKNSVCTIQNNTIGNVATMGIAVLAQSLQNFDAHILNNRVSLSPRGKDAIGILSFSREGPSRTHIEGNTVEGNQAGWFGIYMNNQGPELQQGTIQHNTVIRVQSSQPVQGGGIGVATSGKGHLETLINDNALSENTPQGIVGLGPLLLDASGNLHVTLRDNHAHGPLPADGYTLWNQPAAASTRVLYKDTGGNLGKMQWIPDPSHFTEEKEGS